MTASEPGSGLPAQTEPDAGGLRRGPWGTDGDAAGSDHRAGSPAARTGNPLPRLGSKPIVWKWWVLAALLSLGMWAGIVAILR